MVLFKLNISTYSSEETLALPSPHMLRFGIVASTNSILKVTNMNKDVIVNEITLYWWIWTLEVHIFSSLLVIPTPVATSNSSRISTTPCWLLLGVLLLMMECIMDPTPVVGFPKCWKDGSTIAVVEMRWFLYSRKCMT